LGREPRSVTTFEYDGRGRLVRAITVREPEWLEEDRDWATADLHEQASKCSSGCGLPLDETTDPANEGAYEAPLPTRCFACTTLSARQAEYKEDPSSLLFHVRKVR
jgi:hypothetical protein